MFGCNTVPYKRLQRLFCHQCKYTAHAAKQRTGLYSVFSVDLTYSSAHNTVTTQADYTPPAPRWSVSQRRSISSAYHRYNRHAGRCTAQHSRPIIIMYIRVRRCYGSTPDSAAYHRPCQPGGVIPAACDLAPGQQSERTGWHPLPGGQSSNRGAAGGAEPLAALAVSLFGLSPDS